MATRLRLPERLGKVPGLRGLAEAVRRPLGENVRVRLARYREVGVCVLGAAGFVGRWVARSLSLQQARLTLVVREIGSAQRIFERYDIEGDVIVLDLNSLDSVAQFLRQRRSAPCLLI